MSALCPDDLRNRLQSNIEVLMHCGGGTHSTVGSGNALQVVRTRVRFPDGVIGIFH